MKGEKKKMKKNFARVLSCAIALVMAISMFGIVAVFAGDDTPVYDGTSISESLQGEGTEASPYLIQNGADLKYFEQNAAATTGKFYKLTSDIVWSNYSEAAEAPAASNWTPVNFNGTFDGDGHTIYGLYINTPDAKQIGFFGTASGTIKNLTLKDSAIIAGQYVGGFVGAALIGTADAPTSLTIENCVNYVNVTATLKNTEVGGFIGQAFSTPKTDGGAMTITITKCINYGSVNGTYNGTAYAGGIVGRLLGSNGSIISECINYGKVTAAKAVAGGIVGQSSLANHTDYPATHSIVISDCLNAGDVTAQYISAGIIGRAYGLTTIKNCVSTGKIVATASDATNSIRYNPIDGGNGGAILATHENNYYLAGSAVNTALPEAKPEITVEGAKTEAELNTANMAAALGEKWLYNTTDGLMLVAFATAAPEVPGGDNTTVTPPEVTTKPVDDVTTQPADITTKPADVTTTEPKDDDTTTVPVYHDTTTKAPVVTDAPTSTDAPEKEKGCGGFAVAAQLIAVLGAAVAVVAVKKKI